MSIALRFSKIEPDQRPLLLGEIQSILSEVGAHNAEIYNQAYWGCILGIFSPMNSLFKGNNLNKRY